MALQFPHGFPEPYTLPVIAAEAIARAELEAALQAVELRRLYPTGYSATYYVQGHLVEPLVVDYLNAVCAAFASQACKAVEERAMRASTLDTAVENFVGLAQTQALFGLNHEKIRSNIDWRDSDRFYRDTRDQVITAPWHTEYLGRIPGLFASLAEGSAAEQPTEETDQRIRERADRRRGVVMPLLGSKGCNVERWAQLAGVHRTVAFEYLSGRTEPRPDSRHALAEALGLEPHNLPD